MHSVTHLLAALERGETVAAEKLLPVVYTELRQLAAARMSRESPGHTLQPTALVTEAYLRLAGERSMHWQDRAHFFGVAAHLICGSRVHGLNGNRHGDLVIASCFLASRPARRRSLGG